MLFLFMSILTAARDIDRLRQITQVLARHGFGELVGRLGLSTEKAEAGKPAKEGGSSSPRRPFGQRLRLVLQDLGPTFVKLGQIISTRPDIIPADIITELKKLQDDVAPISSEEARQQIQQTLGAPVEDLFETFDPAPLASASVAQVHRGTLRIQGSSPPEGDGEVVEVAVKIQRPNIQQMVQRDLHLLYLLAGLIERTVAESRVYSPTGLVREFDQAITAELDFTIESINADRFSRNFAGDEAIKLPRVYSQASGKQVLTLEFLDGVKIDEAVKRGADGKWIAEEAVRIILKMVFEDGFFHADPHPGNILILPAPPDQGPYNQGQPVRVGLLDLGLVGRLSPKLRDQSVDLLMAAARNDPDAMADAMLAIGNPREKVDYEAFRAHVRKIAERHLGRDLKDMEAAAIVRDIIVGAIKFKIEIPAELTMMVRAMMTIEGVGKEIHPDLDLFAVAKPYLARIIWQRYHPLKLGSELLSGAGRLGAMARDLPFQLQEILEDLRHGRLRLQTEDQKRARALERLGARLRAAVVSAALLGAGITLLVAGQESTLGWGLLAGSGAWMAAHLFCDWRSGKQ